MGLFDDAGLQRPWIEGVAVVANLVGDAVFPVGGVTAEQVAEAVAVVAAHDREVSVDLARRLPLCDTAELRPASSSSDWAEGRQDALCFLASTIQPSADRTSPFSVAVVGMPVTRNEWDCRADLDAVRDLIRDGLGMTAASFWPAPRTDVSSMSAVFKASTILALPDGRRVASVIAGRTGARVVDVDIPMGFDGTSRFLKVAAGAVDRVARADEYLTASLNRVAPRFEWVVGHSLLNRRIGLVGESSFVLAAADFLGEVGCDVCMAGLTAGARDLSGFPGSDDPDPSEPVDLVICNGPAAEICARADLPFLEMTWPCTSHHVLFPRPSLGVDGAAAFLQEMVNRMNFFEIMVSWRNTVFSEEDRERRKARASIPPDTRPE
ncbi:MAG TPA: nitrogenase component 1 [Myxococcota bacterium]|nr:nitrogenase component 1 [Myxococcota bacterium]